MYAWWNSEPKWDNKWSDLAAFHQRNTLKSAHSWDCNLFSMSWFKSLISVLKQLGIVPDIHWEGSCEKLDSDKIHHSQRVGNVPRKQRRKQLPRGK